MQNSLPHVCHLLTNDYCLSQGLLQMLQFFESQATYKSKHMCEVSSVSLSTFSLWMDGESCLWCLSLRIIISFLIQKVLSNLMHFTNIDFWAEIKGCNWVETGPMKNITVMTISCIEKYLHNWETKRLEKNEIWNISFCFCSVKKQQYFEKNYDASFMVFIYR